MEPEITDVSTDPSTVPEGENTTTATPAVVTAPPKDLLGQMRESFAEKTKPTDDGKKDAKPVDGEKKADDAKPGAPKDDKSKAKGDEDKETVPLAAFKKRIGEETGKRKALQEKLDARDNEVSRLRAALEIASSEIHRTNEARQSGAAFDPKDEQIRNFELAQKAREAAEKIATESSAALASRDHNEKVEAIKETLGAEIRTAVADESILSFNELIAELRKPQNAGRSPKDVAAERIAIRTEAFKKTLVKDQRPFPKTAKTKAGGSHSVAILPGKENLDARLAQLRAQNPE